LIALIWPDFQVIRNLQGRKSVVISTYNLASNEFGFIALPAGRRRPEDGKFSVLGRDLGY
jgi:hypothetical protein